MAEATGDAPPAFRIVPVVNSRYAPGSALDIDDAEEEAIRIAALLAIWGGTLDPWECSPDERVVGEIDKRMNAWSEPEASRSSVLLWIGHGQSNGLTASLTVRTTPDSNGELFPEAFAKHIEREHRGRTEPDWAIVIVEACGGARFVELVAAHLLNNRARDGVLLIGSGADRGRGYLGNFRRALERVQAAYSSNDTIITLTDLGGRIEDVLQSSHVYIGGFRGRSPLVVRDPERPTVTTLVDWYPHVRRALDRVPAATLRELSHAGTPADLLEVGIHFTGRADERARIQTWLESQDNGVLTLTGMPGSGKSALLANLVLNATPGLRTVVDETPYLASRWPGAERLPRIDGAIPLTGMRIASVITRIAQLADVDLGDAIGFAQRSDALVAQLLRRGGELTLVADALDEAQDPREIATLLCRIGALPGVRVIVATRHVAGQGLDLVSALRKANPGLVVVPLARDEHALLEFAALTLQRFGPDVLVDVRAAVIADGSTPWDFLRLKLVMNELLADLSLLTDAGATRRRELLALDRDALFETAFARISSVLPQARALLKALANAAGRGLPRADRVWTTVATAHDPDRPLTDADVHDVLAVAGPYIMLDAEDGRSVYRLAHRAFSQQLLPEELAPASQLRVLRRLVELARDTRELSPYLAHHLTGHAAAAGRAGWEELAASADVLDRLDMGALIADTWRFPEAELPAAIRGVLRTSHLAARGGPEDRRGYRELGMVRAGAEPGAAAPDAAWRVLEARLVTHPPHLTVEWPRRAPIRAMTAVEDGDSAMLAAGDDRGRIATFFPQRGPAIELSGDQRSDREVLGLAAVADAHGRHVLVSVNDRKQARVWRLPPEGEPGRLNEFGCVIASCAAWGDTAGRVAIGTMTGRITLWDVGTGERLQRFVGHLGRIAGVVAMHGPTGRGLVSAGRDRSLRVWDPAHGAPVASETGWGAPWGAVAWLPAAGRIVAGDEAGRLTWWSAVGLALEHTVWGHRGAVNALAVLPAAGGASERVVSAGQDGLVRVWDAETGAAVGPDLSGHSDAVTCLAVLRGEHAQHRIASGSRDATIRVWPAGAEPLPLGSPARRSAREPQPEWHLAGARGTSVRVWVDGAGSVVCREGEGRSVRLAAPQARRPRCVTAFAHGGRTVLATAGHDGSVCTWWAATGNAAGPPLEGHTDWVQALTTLLRVDGEPVLVSGGDDGLIVLWEPLTGDALHRIHLGAPIRSLAATAGADVDVEVVLDEGALVLRMSDGLLSAPPA